MLYAKQVWCLIINILIHQAPLIRAEKATKLELPATINGLRFEEESLFHPNPTLGRVYEPPKMPFLEFRYGNLCSKMDVIVREVASNASAQHFSESQLKDLIAKTEEACAIEIQKEVDKKAEILCTLINLNPNRNGLAFGERQKGMIIPRSFTLGGVLGQIAFGGFISLATIYLERAVRKDLEGGMNNTRLDVEELQKQIDELKEQMKRFEERDQAHTVENAKLKDKVRNLKIDININRHALFYLIKSFIFAHNVVGRINTAIQDMKSGFPLNTYTKTDNTVLCL